MYMFNFNILDNLKTYGSRFALGGVLAAIGVGIVKIIKEGNAYYIEDAGSSVGADSASAAYRVSDSR